MSFSTSFLTTTFFAGRYFSEALNTFKFDCMLSEGSENTTSEESTAESADCAEQTAPLRSDFRSAIRRVVASVPLGKLQARHEAAMNGSAPAGDWTRWICTHPLLVVREVERDAEYTAKMLDLAEHLEGLEEMDEFLLDLATDGLRMPKASVVELIPALVNQEREATYESCVKAFEGKTDEINLRILAFLESQVGWHFVVGNATGQCENVPL